MPNVRPRTRFKCRWVPRRDPPRKFTANDAARVMCYAFKQGATRREMDQRFKVVCQGEDRVKSELEEAAEAAMSAVESSNVALLDAYSLFLAINSVLLALIFLSRVIPAPILRPVSVAAVRVQANMGRLITFNITRRAANDAVIQQIQDALVAFRRAA